MSADALLPSREDVLTALGPEARLAPATDTPGGEGSRSTMQGRSSVLAAAASEFAYRSLAGQMVTPDAELPIAVATMALVFDRAAKAKRTFAVVADAAHLKTRIGESEVAVETVTAASGLVSYWGYVHFGSIIVVLTLDTLDPAVVSMTQFRSLVKSAADRLEERTRRR